MQGSGSTIADSSVVPNQISAGFPICGLFHTKVISTSAVARKACNPPSKTFNFFLLMLLLHHPPDTLHPALCKSPSQLPQTEVILAWINKVVLPPHLPSWTFRKAEFSAPQRLFHHYSSGWSLQEFCSVLFLLRFCFFSSPWLAGPILSVCRTLIKTSTRPPSASTKYVYFAITPNPAPCCNCDDSTSLHPPLLICTLIEFCHLSLTYGFQLILFTDCCQFTICTPLRNSSEPHFTFSRLSVA